MFRTLGVRHPGADTSTPLQAAQANAGRSAVAGGNFEYLSQYLPPRTIGINFGFWFSTAPLIAMTARSSRSLSAI